MKKNYETPSIEKVAFQYRDQVVAASGYHTNTCTNYGTHEDKNCWENHDKNVN